MNASKLGLSSGVNVLTIPFTFFSVAAFFSIEYQGFENSLSYIATLTISFALYFIVNYRELFLSRRGIAIRFIFILFQLIIIFDALITGFFKNFESTKFLGQFILMVMPALFFGLQLGFDNRINSIKDILLVIAIINCIGFFSVIPALLSMPVNELITFYGGGHYQGFAYSVSFSFLVILTYYLFYLKRVNILINFLFYLISILLLVCLVLSGARGAFLVVIFGGVILLKLRFKFKRLLLTFLIIGVLLFFIANLLFTQFGEYQDRVSQSLDRILSYIGSEGIDIEQTSNRDYYYTEALNLITASPLIGYGFFGYLGKTGGWYPHNLFLEILLQGGALFLLFFLLGLIVFFKKAIHLFKTSDPPYLLIPVISYSFIQLMFSGTYILEPFFWFSLAYVFATSRNKTLRLAA